MVHKGKFDRWPCAVCVLSCTCLCHAHLSGVLSVLGLPQAAEELLVALISLVCLTSIVWWMFLDDSDECAGRALVKRTGALLCLTFAVLAVAVAFVGFSSFVVATDENVATWLMAGLLGVVGFMALVRAGTPA